MSLDNASATGSSATEADRAVKRDAVRRMIEARDASSLVLTSTAACSWYLGGARVHIDLAGPPILQVRVGRERDEVFLGDNETARMVVEELPADVVVRRHPWFESPVVDAELTESRLDRELRDLRRVLTPLELDRLRSLGRDAASVLTDVLGSADPGMSEFELAGAAAGGLLCIGADPLVVLVQGASRASIRHPLPTSARIGRRAMVIVCARRHGLIANVTRWVRFGDATVEERDADRRILEVEADAFAATRPGATLGGVLDAIRASYPRRGFAAEEWREHHQGGSAGYATREALAVPGSDEVVALGQAFAWNPTGPGAKVEDTVLVTEAGVEPLTVDPRWPTVRIGDLDRPAVLER